MQLSTKLIAGAVLGVCLAGAATVIWQHYSGLVDAKAKLSARVTSLEADVTREQARADAYKDSIGKWESAAARQVEALGDLTVVQRAAGTYSRELKNVLSKHDLEALAARKPGLIEDRINAGTSRALRVLEHATEGPAARPGKASTSTDLTGTSGR